MNEEKRKKKLPRVGCSHTQKGMRHMNIIAFFELQHSHISFEGFKKMLCSLDGPDEVSILHLHDEKEDPERHRTRQGVLGEAMRVGGVEKVAAWLSVHSLAVISSLSRRPDRQHPDTPQPDGGRSLGNGSGNRPIGEGKPIRSLPETCAGDLSLGRTGVCSSGSLSGALLRLRFSNSRPWELSHKYLS